MKKQHITKENLSNAEILFGLEFTNEKREKMLGFLNSFLFNYKKNRKIKLKYDVEPPLYFNPQLPGVNYFIEPKSNNFSKVTNIELPSKIEEVAFYSLTQLSWLLKEQKISSMDLTNIYLQRLKKYNPILECVITFTEDIALKQAEIADNEILEGNYRGPLHGIPYGIKDLFAFPNFPTTWGAEPYKNQVINEKAMIIKRLEQAGAIMIAKLSMGELASDHIWFGGKTKSPWNLEEPAGGSSSGSAAAVSAGLVGFTIGTETWGSIINPSERCGATGLRPTYGRVSRHGVMPLSWTMDKIGPICRTVEDCAIVFNIIHGSDGYDKTVVDMPFNWNVNQSISDIRIGYTKDIFEKVRDSKKYDDETLNIIRKMGVNLIPINLPTISNIALYIIILAEAATFFEELTLTGKDELLVNQSEYGWANEFRSARMIPAVEYLKANRIRRLVMKEMYNIFTNVDVFITPTIDHSNDFWTTTSNFLTNLTGNPAVTVPNGFKENNMPSSITFIGDLYKEAETLRVAKAFQDATEFHKRRPNLFLS